MLCRVLKTILRRAMRCCCCYHTPMALLLTCISISPHLGRVIILQQYLIQYFVPKVCFMFHIFLILQKTCFFVFLVGKLSTRFVLCTSQVFLTSTRRSCFFPKFISPLLAPFLLRRHEWYLLVSAYYIQPLC